MKTLFVSLAALLFAFLIGCQSSITDPVVPEKSDNTSAYSQIYASKDWISSLPGEIELNDFIQVPNPSIDELAELEGSIRYSIEKVYFDAPPPSPQSAYKVGMYINATVTCKTLTGENVWLVKNTSQDYVYISNNNETVKYLVKTFTVQKACPVPLDLVLKFEVTEKELILFHKELKVHRGSFPIGDPVF